LGYLDGVTSLIQAQIDAKAPANNPTFTGTVSGITKGMVGLNLVDNTSDADKPISTLQQTALDGKASTSVTINTASGLTGGGSLALNRTISLDVPSLANKATPSSSDQVLIYDPVSSSHKKTTVSGITSGLSGGGGGVTAHGALTGLNADDHPQYSLADGTRWTVTPTANKVVISTASGVLASSSISTTELGYLSGVTSLIQGQLNNKTDSGHTHSIANIANLQTDLNARVLTSRVIATASGLTGGGDLSADRTIGLNIPGLATKTTPSILDEVLIYDVSTSTHRRTTVSGITSYSGGGGGVTAHSALTGLSNDDHPQYSLANGTRWTVTPTANRVVISTASGVLSSSSISTSELGYLSGVTSLIQAQINNKTDSGHTHTIADINNLQADLNTRAVTSRVIATASGLTGGGDLSDNRTIALNISALQSKTTPSILDEVLIYDVSTSTHRRTTVSGITGYSGGGGGVTDHNALTGLTGDDHPQYSLADGTRWAADQTANRVVISTASGVLASSSISTTELGYLSGVTSLIQGQIDLKAPINNPVFTGTVSGITKAMVGLSNVDNTSDINKPISTLQQTALDLKAPINNPIFTGTVSGITKAMVGLSNVDNTSDINKPISTLQQAGLDLKVSNSRVIATASGLTGGGDLSADRTIALNISGLQAKTNPSILDEVLIYDVSTSTHRRTTVSGITGYSGGGGGVTAHNALTGLNADDHPQYSLANGTRWAADQTANRVAISTASGHLSASSITTTELSYLSGVTSLIQGQIDNKTASGHTHSIADINNLQTNLDSRVLSSRVIATASGLTGGGDLSADRTIGLNIQALQSKTVPANVDQVLIYGISESAHRVTTVSGLTSGLQPLLVSEVTIKTINNQSVLGSGNLTITGGGGGSPTITTLTDAATVTPNVDTTTIGILNSLSQNATIANPTGTPVNYQELVLRITSASIRRIVWGSAYAGLLPNTTSGGGIEDYFYFRFNSLDNKFDLVSSNQPSDEVELSYLVSTLILTGNL